jgi:hypothetical protein
MHARASWHFSVYQCIDLHIIYLYVQGEFYRLKKHVLGASQLTRPKALIAAVNYIIFLEKTILKMTEENPNALLPSSMDCTWPFSPVDLTVHSPMDS